MDRFIDYDVWSARKWQKCLKSNMDRFIVGDYKATYRARKHFKIQYG